MHLVESWDTIEHLSPVHAMTAPQDVQACCQAESRGPQGKAVNICHPGDILTARYQEMCGLQESGTSQIFLEYIHLDLLDKTADSSVQQ